MALSIAGSIILTIVGILAAPAALRAMGTPDDLMTYAAQYIRIYFGGTLFSMIYNMGAGMLRAVGDSKRPLYFLIASCGVNIVLDLLFVVVFRLEVIGVAIATVLSQVFSAVLVIITLVRTTMPYHLDFRKIRFHMTALKKIVWIGFAGRLPGNDVQHFQRDYPVQYQHIQHRCDRGVDRLQQNRQLFLDDYECVWIDGFYFCQPELRRSELPQTSKERADLYDAVGRRHYHTFCSPLSLRRIIFRLFTKDAAVIEEGIKILQFLVPTYITYVCIEILCSAVRGTGDSILPTMMTCFGVCVLRIAWIALAVPAWHDIRMVIVSYPITWATTSLLFVIYYLQGGWLRRQIAANGFKPEEKAI